MDPKYRVWWVPQWPMEPFFVEVETLEQGQWLCNVLADYDIFQFENHIKPDYCNMGGIEVFENDEWVEYDSELEVA